MKSSTGTLFVVSTPIGNLYDLSPRAQETLLDVDYILCETRLRTINLFQKLANSIGDSNIDLRKIDLRKYEGQGVKGQKQREQVIRDLRSGQKIALVSNSGTPVVSDPGQALVKAVIKAGLPVLPIPGPTAFLSAAVVSGLPIKNLIFLGYLPKREARIQKVLSRAKSAIEALEEPASLVFYVSKYQLSRTLSCIKQVFGPQAAISLAREMTKLHEEHFTGSVEAAESWLDQISHRRKGEFTFVLNLGSASLT